LNFLFVICPQGLRGAVAACNNGGGLGLKSDATTLLRAASVVWNRCHIRDGIDANTQGCQRANRRLAARAWSFDLDIEVLDTLIHGGTACHFGSHLSGKWS